jgi:hypothetical protein
MVSQNHENVTRENNEKAYIGNPIFMDVSTTHYENIHVYITHYEKAKFFWPRCRLMGGRPLGKYFSLQSDTSIKMMIIQLN